MEALGRNAAWVSALHSQLATASIDGVGSPFTNRKPVHTATLSTTHTLQFLLTRVVLLTFANSCDLICI